MKVIKRGGWTMKVPCKGCWSVLQVDKEDVGSAEYGSFDDVEVGYYVMCEVCGEGIRLDSRSVPEHVKSLAHAKRQCARLTSR